MNGILVLPVGYPMDHVLEKQLQNSLTFLDYLTVKKNFVMSPANIRDNNPIWDNACDFFRDFYKIQSGAMQRSVSLGDQCILT